MNPYKLLAMVVALVAVASASYYKGYNAGQGFVQQQWDEQMRKLAEDRTREIELARKKEQVMQNEAEHIRLEKDREIQKINSRLASLSSSLRNRPERPERPSNPSPVSGAAPACVAASGAELARRDGEFLAGYGASAAKLQADYDQCVRQYNQVRQMLADSVKQ
jgi:hypothetical protein